MWVRMQMVYVAMALHRIAIAMSKLAMLRWNKEQEKELSFQIFRATKLEWWLFCKGGELEEYSDELYWRWTLYNPDNWS